MKNVNKSHVMIVQYWTVQYKSHVIVQSVQNKSHVIVQYWTVQYKSHVIVQSVRNKIHVIVQSVKNAQSYQNHAIMQH